jgi:hypothetical protein
MDSAQDTFDQIAFTHNRPRLKHDGIIAALAALRVVRSRPPD